MSTKSKPTTEQPTFRNNAEVDAKIDAHIKENPEHWNWIKALPRERLERMLILNEVRHLDRQQNFKKNIIDQVEADPARKQAYEILMKDVPEEQRADLIAQLEKRKWRANQSKTQSQRQSAAVRV
jgi:hypothetical protein